MSLIYGTDSAMPANTRLTNGYNLYEWVMRKSCFPSFWGRSLTGERRITAEEIEFLRSKRCKIALVIRDLNEQEICQNDGTHSAIKAVEAAKNAGVPQNKGIALFAYIPSEWSVNHNWMTSFAGNLLNNGYIPGFIGNTRIPPKTSISTASAATMSLLRETQISFTLFTGLQNQSITSIRISGRHMLLPSFFQRICTFGAMEI